MADELAIGVDIGGTKIAFALVNREGRVLATHRLPTLPAEGVEAVVDRVAQGIHHLLEQTEQPVGGVGIGCPGHLNPISGVIHNATNLAWSEVPLKAGVQARLKQDLPVWVLKDANASALGEMYFGAARGCNDFVYIALGTGLGGGAGSAAISYKAANLRRWKSAICLLCQRVANAPVACMAARRCTCRAKVSWQARTNI